MHDASQREFCTSMPELSLLLACVASAGVPAARGPPPLHAGNPVVSWYRAQCGEVPRDRPPLAAARLDLSRGQQHGRPRRVFLPCPPPVTGAATTGVLGAGSGGRLLFGSGLITSLPAILAVAFLAGRLLGVRRSLATTLLSGLAGWVAGTGLSLLIASGDPEAPGFGRNVWVFSVVFTMSAAVWVELLAKPGSLARAQQGLVRVPRPLRALRRSSQRGAPLRPDHRDRRQARLRARARPRRQGRPGRGRGRPAAAGRSPAARPRRVRRHVRQARPDPVDPLGPAACRRHRRAVEAAGPGAAGGPG